MSGPRTTSCLAPDQGTTQDMAMVENPLSAFAAVQLDTRRSLHKPRTSGLTMISEWGLGPHALADFLSIAAPYVDMVKIPTGSARLYGLEQLRAKLARYRGERISSLIGGQFQEYVLHTEGEAALPRHFDDVRAAGFDLVEISANWYLDDLPPMMFIKASPNSHGFVNPRDIEQLWRDQFDWVYREYEWAIFPLTVHPDVSGRPQVLLMLERLIEYISGHSGVRWCTMEEMAEEFRHRHPFKG